MHHQFEPQWWLIVGYLLASLALGAWAGRRRINTVDDMAVAGRSSGPWLVAFSVAATWINGVTLISMSGLGRDYGLGGYWSGGSFMVATIWAGYYIVPKLRATRIITIPQLFDTYFGPTTHKLALVLSLLRDLGATAGVMGALAVVTAQLLDVSIVEALLLTYGMTLLYVFIGGMWAVLITDAFQFVIIMVGSLWLLARAIAAAGGTAIDTQLPPEMLDPVGAVGMTQVVGWLVTGLAITVGYQSLLQRALAASDSDTARRGFLYGGVISVLWYMVPYVLGVCGRVLYGTGVPSEEVFLRLTFDVGRPLESVVIVTILAASMSTLSATVNTIASNVSIDIYSRYINPGATQRAQLWIFRANILLVGVVAAVIYYLIPLMLELFWLGGRVMAASLSPALVALVLFPRTRAAPRAVLTAMAVGAASVVLWQSVLGGIREKGSMVVIWSLDPILIGLPLCLLILWVGTLHETRDIVGSNRAEVAARKV